jgi:hypothetical protein
MSNHTHSDKPAYSLVVGWQIGLLKTNKNYQKVSGLIESAC